MAKKQNQKQQQAPVVKADKKGKPGSGVTKVNTNKGKGGGKTGNTKPIETNKQQIKNLKSKLKTNITPQQQAKINQRIKFLGGGKGGKNGPKGGKGGGRPAGPPVQQAPTSGGPTYQMPGFNPQPISPEAINDAKVNNPGSMYGIDVGGEIDESAKQINYQNPNQTNPFGSQTTTLNPDGTVSVDQNLSADQQKILDQDEALAQAGRGIAQSQIGNFTQPWEADTAPRNFQGGFTEDRLRMEDAVYKNLTRDNAEMKKRDREDMERTMFNRGIALDPRNEQYAKSQELLDKRYDTLDENAKLQATQYGGDELAKQFAQQEQLIANQFAQGQATHGQQLSDLGQFANFSVGQQTPSFQGYQGPNYDVNDPSSYVYQAKNYKEANQNQQIGKNQFNQTMDYNYDALGQQMAMQEKAIAAAKASTQAPSTPAFP